jgi:hypothetical protein
MITQKQIHDLAVKKGWWESWGNPLDRLPTTLMLMVSELAECLEEYRNGRGATEIYYEYKTEPHISIEPSRPLPANYKATIEFGKPCGIPIELADCAIRIKDTCEALDIDLEKMIELKYEFNKTRPYQHGNKRA